MIYKEQLERVLRLMIERRDDLREELKSLPEGELYAEVRSGKHYYSQRLPQGGNRKKEHRKGITRDSATVLALARKRYVEAALSELDANIRALEKLLQNYRASDEASLMGAFLTKYPELRTGIYNTENDLAQWVADFEPLDGFYEKDLRSQSLKGEPMRSAGEIYIASRLDHYKIPYRYEAPLAIPDLSDVPDFTIMRPRDRKIIYWEHFGKTGSQEYIDWNYHKVGRYMDYGIVPWDNFIMTFNYSKGGFNAQLIDAMIEAWLL